MATIAMMQASHRDKAATLARQRLTQSRNNKSTSDQFNSNRWRRYVPDEPNMRHAASQYAEGSEEYFSFATLNDASAMVLYSVERTSPRLIPVARNSFSIA